MTNRFRGLALTFDDILLEPASSAVIPSEVKISTELTKKIKINIPIISAAMDTVTQSPMAIGLARYGGIGVVHRNLSDQDQVEEVKKIKRSESGIIRDPITLKPHATLEEAKTLMTQYRVSGIPVVNGERLTGIITERDLRLETNFSKKVGIVMTSKKLITAKVGITLSQAEKFLKSEKSKNFQLLTVKEC